ncbi:MAG: hypothetical protein ACE3L7_26785 [Candidatus Pristimantibacillus sp.]
MNEIIRNDLRIVGSTTSVGGVYHNVSITGDCLFNGDIDCERLKLTGEAKVVGNLRMKQMNITGECKVDGRLDGISLGGRGEVETAAGLRIDRIKFTGNLDIKGDCEAEDLKLAGGANVEGLLSAERLDISLFGPSWAKEVGGSKIVIKSSIAGNLLKLIKPKDIVLFKAVLIEGDHVELHQTKAEIVRGDHVIIGNHCEIQTVEYRDTLEIHKNAIVRNQIKL